MNTETRFQRRPLIRLLAFLCTLAMLLSVAAVLPITVSAKTYTYKVKNQKEFLDAMAKIRGRGNSDTSTVTFTQDLTITLDDDEYLFEQSQSKLFVGGTNLIFDLNGKTITFHQKSSYSFQYPGTSGLSIFYLRLTNLVIRDTSDGKTGVMKFDADDDVKAPARAFSFTTVSDTDAGGFTLESGTLDGCGIRRNMAGGCVYASGILSYMKHHISLTGGIIQNFDATNGGAIYVGTGAKTFSKFLNVNLSGGTIRNCNASGNGGAVCINAGTLNLSGSTIQNCTAKNAGGAISVENSNTKFNMTGGTITGCSSAEDGGAIYNAGTTVLSGGTISKNEATGKGRGGALYCATGSATTLSGTTIESNKAVNGGGIFMWGGTVDMTGGILRNNTASSNGSQVCQFHTNKEADVVFNMTGGEIYSSLPSNGPSAIYASTEKDKITISGSSVVSVAGSSYAFDNGADAQLSINGGTVTAYSKDGKAYRNKPQVASGMTMEIDETGTSNLFWSSDLTYVGSPSTKASDYQESFVRLSKNAVHSVKLVNNGSTVHSFMGVEGGLYIIPTDLQNPTRDGYVFGGWKDQDGNLYNADNFYTFIMGSKDLTITAIWERYEFYTIKWMTGGALPQSEIFSTASMYAGTSKIDLPMASMAKKDGFEIEGWYIGDTKLSGSGIVVKDVVDKGLADGNVITITAKYKRAASTKTYKLTYVVNIGGKPAWSQTVEYAQGEVIASSPTPDLSGTGYGFKGWIDLPATMPGNDLEVKGKIEQLWANLYFDYGNGKIEKYPYRLQVTSDVQAMLDWFGMPDDPTPPDDYHYFDHWDGIPDTMPENDVTATAVFLPRSYQLTIKFDNGEKDIVTNVTYGTLISLPDDPEREGYTFAGWEGVPADGKMPGEALTITATWEPKTYQLTVKLNNGQQDIVSDVAYGDTITLPTDLTKTGHAFTGWDGVPADGKMPANDLTITAKWSTNDYKLTVKLGNGEKDIVSDVAYGDTITLPTDITKTGHSFTGWDNLPADGKMPANNLTITAKWSKNAYQLTVKLGNGEKDIVSDVAYGDTITLPTDITKTGHSFTGWDNLPADGKMPANDLTITAKWSTNDYKLTVKLNNGQQDIVSDVAYGDTITLPTDPTNSGYSFTGWDNLPADGKMPANNLTITAKWSKNAYQLTVKLGNGEKDIVSNVAYGDTITLPTDPTNTGYSFTGWDNLPADGKMPANDLTITAKWRKIGLESITIDPTADLTLYLTAYLPDDCANAILRVTLNGKTVELQPTAGTATDMYDFTYTGVAPYTLSHSLTLALVLNGQTIDSRTTSAAEICVEVAKTQPALKQTVADLMAFCAATADYLGYDTTTAPAIRDLMDANGLIASDREVGTSDTKYISARPAGDTRLMGVGLYFENTTGMYVRIKTSNVSRVTLTVGRTTYTADDFTQKDWTEYVLYLPGVTLNNLTQINRVSLCVDGKEIQYMDYAITDYIAVTYKGTGTYSDGIRALTKALYNWKETAEQV